MKFAYLFPLFAMFSSPMFAGQVGVINPGGIVSITVAPAPPSNVVAPPALPAPPYNVVSPPALPAPPSNVVVPPALPAPPSNVVTPPALTSTATPLVPPTQNVDKVATNVSGSPELKENIRYIDVLLSNVEVSNFTPAQIRELLSKIERTAFNDSLSPTSKELLRREYERLSALNVEY